MDEKEIEMYVSRIRQLDKMISGLALGSPEYNAAVREKDTNQKLLTEARKVNIADCESGEKIRVEEERLKNQHELEIEKIRIEEEKIELEKKKLEQAKAEAEANRKQSAEQFEKEQKATKRRHLVDKIVIIVCTAISGGIGFAINRSNQIHDIRSSDPDSPFLPRKDVHKFDVKPGDTNRWSFWK